MGAALEATGVDITRLDPLDIIGQRLRGHIGHIERQGWEWATDDEETYNCLVCMCEARSASGIIAHLNDYHQWTREQIADWVEGIEKQLESEQAQAAEVEVCA